MARSKTPKRSSSRARSKSVDKKKPASKKKVEEVVAPAPVVEAKRDSKAHAVAATETQWSDWAGGAVIFAFVLYCLVVAYMVYVEQFRNPVK